MVHQANWKLDSWIIRFKESYTNLTAFKVQKDKLFFKNRIWNSHGFKVEKELRPKTK